MKSTRTTLPQLRQFDTSKTLPMVQNQSSIRGIHTNAIMSSSLTKSLSALANTGDKASMSTLAINRGMAPDSVVSFRRGIPVLGLGADGSDNNNNNNNDNNDNTSGLRRGPHFDDESSSRRQAGAFGFSKRFKSDSSTFHDSSNDDMNDPSLSDQLRGMDEEVQGGGSGNTSVGIFGSGLFALLGLLLSLEDLWAALFGTSDDDDDR